MNQIPNLRAWHNGKMWDVVGYHYTVDESPYKNYIWLRRKEQNEYNIPGFLNKKIDYDDEEIKDVKIMMSTGLFDSQGKEIFEGDVLKWEHSTEGIYDVVKFEEHYINGVKTLGFYRENKYCQMAICQELLNELKFEVIGNYWANPELLTESGEQNES